MANHYEKFMGIKENIQLIKQIQHDPCEEDAEELAIAILRYTDALPENSWLDITVELENIGDEQLTDIVRIASAIIIDYHTILDHHAICINSDIHQQNPEDFYYPEVFEYYLANGCNLLYFLVQAALVNIVIQKSSTPEQFDFTKTVQKLVDKSLDTRYKIQEEIEFMYYALINEDAYRSENIVLIDKISLNIRTLISNEKLS